MAFRISDQKFDIRTITAEDLVMTSPKEVNALLTGLANEVCTISEGQPYIQHGTQYSDLLKDKDDEHSRILFMRTGPKQSDVKVVAFALVELFDERDDDGAKTGMKIAVLQAYSTAEKCGGNGYAGRVVGGGLGFYQSSRHNHRRGTD